LRTVLALRLDHGRRSSEEDGASTRELPGRRRKDRRTVTDMPLQQAAHSAAGFSIAVPGNWRLERDVGQCALFALEPPRPEGVFTANLNVVVEEAGDLDPDQLAQRHVEGLATTLIEHRLIDVEEIRLDGRRAVRFLSIHRFRLHSLALEQWLIPAGRRSFVVSATAEAIDYDEVRGTFAAMVEGFHVDGEGGA
jgi:hypothetical protein